MIKWLETKPPNAKVEVAHVHALENGYDLDWDNGLLDDNIWFYEDTVNFGDEN